jgi:hypothetical protein
MPNATSLISRMARLRRSYTGETQSTVLPEIRNGLEALNPEDRAQLVGAFTNTFHEPLSLRAKAALIPEAGTPSQQHLEAAVLKASSRNAFTQRQVFWMVRPRVNDDGLLGIVGLRARVFRRHVELHLLDTDQPATVALAGVAYRRWTEVLDMIDADRADGDPLRWQGKEPQPLCPIELELQHSTPHAPVASAVLRRIGPSTARVMLGLLHQIAGLSAQACEGTDTHLVITVSGAQLLLRGPDLRPTTTLKEPAVTSDQTPMTAADLCARIVDRLGSENVHVYGAGANDAILVGLEHTTTVLATHGGRQRWFKVTVEEFFPEQVSVLSLDHDVLVTLARRAGVPRPAFGLGPS